MKAKYAYSNLIIGLLLLIGFLMSIRSFAQPDYDFRDPVLLSGTDRQVGAVYLFSNVKTGVDARMTINFISPGIVVTELDGASGYPEALQPTLVADPFTNGYLEMYIEFLEAGTFNLMIQTEVPVTCIDVDGWLDNDGLGNPLHEFDQVDLGGGYVDYQLSGGELSVVQEGNWFKGKNVGGIDYPGRDTAAKQAMFTSVNGNISSCVIRVGVDNQSTISANRLRSIYFKKFIYPNSLLSKSPLLSFQGLQKDNLIELKWILGKENSLKSVVIERGNKSSEFISIGEVSINLKAEQVNYNFLDDENFTGDAYYRLRMISVNGKSTYSNIIVFHAGNITNAFRIYPSIVQTTATIQVKSETNATAIFQLVDYSGRIVVQKNVQVHEGTNNIVVHNLGSVYPGNYVVLVKMNNKVYNQKIFKQ
ncbi:MAG: T9SS type A sorting domain-containing protein [Chitinophagaceae bacterium]|nr:T9SS type A sorting domain-containing protein [Chitinophagaceae bacterium]